MIGTCCQKLSLLSTNPVTFCNKQCVLTSVVLVQQFYICYACTSTSRTNFSLASSGVYSSTHTYMPEVFKQQYPITRVIIYEI